MAESASEIDEPQVTVPKFASFKGAQPPPPHTARDEAKHREKDASSLSKPHPSKTRSHSHRPENRESSRHRQSRHHRRHQPSETPDAPQLAPDKVSPKLFFVDTRPDVLITRYGGLDRAHIPVYERYGGGRVLGTSGRLIIHRDGPRDSFSLRFPGDGAGLSHRDGLRSKSLRIKWKPIRVRARSSLRVDVAENGQDGFIAVRRAKKRRRSLSGGLSDQDEELSYRSIEGRATVDALRHETEATSSEEDDEAIPTDSDDNSLRWKSIQLNKRVKDDPKDVKAWLELVDHQDDLQRAGESVHQQATADVAHSFSEIKVSMLETALDHISGALHRTPILVRLMREGMKVWPSKVTDKKWSLISPKEAEDFELWRAHADFAMSNVAAATSDSIRQFHLNRLQSIRARSDLCDAVDCEEAIYVFLRAMAFIHDSGYKEIAVAAWQALLELNLFRPHTEDHDTLLESFWDFWESETARLGEAGAQGWRHFVASAGQVETLEPQGARVEEGMSMSEAFKAWSRAECLHSSRAEMPARTMDDSTEDDPFRVVMFSDVEPWLFMMPAPRLEGQAREQLLDAFLLFCGLPPAFNTSTWTALAARDQFTQRSAVIGSGVPAESLPTIEDDNLAKRKPLAFGAGNSQMAISPAVLFSGGGKWFNYFGSSMANLPVHAPWLLAALRQLVLAADIQGLAQYYLGLVLATEPTEVRKTAKVLLKKYPDAAELYNAYALAEYANGNDKIAAKVIEAARASPSLSSGALGSQLCKSWSLMEFQDGQKTAAVARLCSIVEQVGVPAPHGAQPESAEVIAARTGQVLYTGYLQHLHAGDVTSAALYAECWTWFSYLKASAHTGHENSSREPMSLAQGDIVEAMAEVERISDQLKSYGYAGSPVHERFLQSAAQMLHIHASRGSYRRAYIREQLMTFLAYFPRNTIFLALLEQADSSLRVIDETRQVLHDKILVQQHDCISSRIFAIRHELSRGNINSAASAFEHALSSDACKFSIGLWVSYIRFCASHHTLRSKARDVFYRALRHCPCSKDVMMEAFSTLYGGMTSDDLRSVYDTMTSKGLRVYIDLDDFVERWKM